jgi:signal transduction histidine kinase
MPMPWSIRNQILIPLVLIQAIAVTATALTTATLAAKRIERQVVDRLNGVVATLGHSNFPYTGGVLAKMRGLSGAHFVAYTGDGHVTETSLPGLAEVPPALRAAPASARVGPLGEGPSAVLGGTRYLAATLRTPGAPAGVSLLVLYPETSWRQARAEAAMPPILLGVGSLAAMAAVTGWVAHSISLRIGRVQTQVTRVAEGHFQHLDPGPRRDEVGELARSINRMCDQLQQMQETIRTSERTRLLARLAAGLAHQLRNALTGARMSVQLHARRCPTAAQDESLDVALRQLAMTEEQIKGLLSLGRVERRPVQRCDVRQTLDDVALLVQPSCRHAKVTLQFSRADTPLERLADPGGLRAAVLNLTLNAIEAAGAGGKVRLGAFPDGDGLTVEVADDGPGPPPELAGVLCEAFVTGKPEGVGLGLALARQVAEEHGGQLSWTREGGETRFVLHLPAESPAPGGAEPAWAAS